MINFEKLLIGMFTQLQQLMCTLSCCQTTFHSDVTIGVVVNPAAGMGSALTMHCMPLIVFGWSRLRSGASFSQLMTLLASDSAD